MARDARIEIDWADDTYTFRLGWGELAKLQEACDVGPYVVLDRLFDGTWRVEYITNVVRLGLIGGGLDPVLALKKVREYIEARPPAENVMFAQAILSAGILGAPDEPSGEADAPNPAETASTISPTAS